MTDIDSHNEGGKKGIASNHGDPEHYWRGLGMKYTMDGFRKDVKAAMGDAVKVTVSKPSTPSKPSKPNTAKTQIAVDGSWGPATTRAAQKVFKTTVDSIVSNQPRVNRGYLPAASTSTWEFKEKGYKAGSSLIRAIQKKVGVDADGWFGPNSIKAFQRWLNVTADGSMGPATVKAFQRWLNKNM